MVHALDLSGIVLGRGEESMFSTAFGVFGAQGIAQLALSSSDLRVQNLKDMWPIEVCSSGVFYI